MRLATSTALLSGLLLLLAVGNAAAEGLLAAPSAANEPVLSLMLPGLDEPVLALPPDFAAPPVIMSGTPDPRLDGQDSPEGLPTPLPPISGAATALPGLDGLGTALEFDASPMLQFNPALLRALGVMQRVAVQTAKSHPLAGALPGLEGGPRYALPGLDGLPLGLAQW